MAKPKQKDTHEWSTFFFALALLSFAVSAVPAFNRHHDKQRLDPGLVKIVDGDTIALGDRDRPLRLLQINSPELSQCQGRRAKDRLRQLIDRANKLEIRYDSNLAAQRFGRTLAYLEGDGHDLGLRLVREGLARPYFISGERGDRARAISRAADRARVEHRGIWQCPQSTPN